MPQAEPASCGLGSVLRLAALMLVAFLVIAPIGASLTVIDPLARRGMERSRCQAPPARDPHNGTLTPAPAGSDDNRTALRPDGTCVAQTDGLETMRDLALSVAPATAVLCGAVYDAAGGYRTGLIFVASWALALAAIGLAPSSGALWAVATGVAGGAGGSLVQAMAYWHVRRVIHRGTGQAAADDSNRDSASGAAGSPDEALTQSPATPTRTGGEDRRYALANTALIVAFDFSAYLAIPLADWVGWDGVPLWAVYPCYAAVVGVPAAIYLGLAFRGSREAITTEVASATERSPLMVVTNEHRTVDDSTKPAAEGAIQQVRGVVGTFVFAAHALQIACVLTFGTFSGSVIGTVFRGAGASDEVVHTVRRVTPYAGGTIALWSLVVGEIAGRWGPRRGIALIDYIQLATVSVGTTLLVAGLLGKSCALLVVGYVATFFWRSTGFPMLNLLWPVVFGQSHPRGIGTAGGLASTLGGATSAVVGVITAHLVHDNGAALPWVIAILGGVSCVAAGLAALSINRHTFAPTTGNARP